MGSHPPPRIARAWVAAATTPGSRPRTSPTSPSPSPSPRPSRGERWLPGRGSAPLVAGRFLLLLLLLLLPAPAGRATNHDRQTTSLAHLRRPVHGLPAHRPALPGLVLRPPPHPSALCIPQAVSTAFPFPRLQARVQRHTPEGPSQEWCWQTYKGATARLWAVPLLGTEPENFPLSIQECLRLGKSGIGPQTRAVWATASARCAVDLARKRMHAHPRVQSADQRAYRDPRLSSDRARARAADAAGCTRTTRRVDLAGRLGPVRDAAMAI